MMLPRHYFRTDAIISMPPFISASAAIAMISAPHNTGI